jgi:surface antigen
MTTPSVGRIVHYVSYGTPGGEYGRECRAAIVTQINDDGTVGLAVMNPTGQFFNPSIFADHTENQGGTWHWPERTD